MMKFARDGLPDLLSNVKKTGRFDKDKIKVLDEMVGKITYEV